MKSPVLFTVAAAYDQAPVAGGTLSVTWEDCGDASTHGHITDLQPTQIEIGSDGTMTGTGTIDEQLTDGDFEIKLTASLGITETYTGKACEAKTFDLPLGIGSVIWGGLDCPVAAGSITTGVGFKTSSAIPAALAKADVSASATDQNGDKAVCITAHLARQSAAPAPVAGGTMAITWEDCGDASTHGHITDLQPTQIEIGSDGTMTGTGTTDEQLTDGNFEIQLTASLGIKETYTGKACEAKTFDLPLGIGSVSWGGLDCPVAAGTITAGVGFKTIAAIPAALATADVSASATDQNGDKALCITAHLARQSVEVVPVAGGTLAVTWEDCGDASTHGHITDLQPAEIEIGSDGTMTGTGTIDEELSDGDFTIQLTASLGIKETYTGKACEAKTFDLPLGIGSVMWGGLDCPVAAGTITTGVGFKTIAAIPATLAKVDVSVSATDQNGDKAVCVTAHLERQSAGVSV